MTNQHAMLLRALATELSVDLTHPHLERFCGDLAEVLSDWFALYDEGPHFYAQGVLDFEEGKLDVWSFAPRRKSKRRRNGSAA